MFLSWFVYSLSFYFSLCFLIFLLWINFFLLENCVNLSVHCNRLMGSSCRSSYVRGRCPVLCGQCNTSTMKPSTTKPIASTGMYRSLRPSTLFKEWLWHRWFPVNFAKFLRTPFLQNTFWRLFLYVSPRRIEVYTLFQKIW